MPLGDFVTSIRYLTPIPYPLSTIPYPPIPMSLTETLRRLNEHSAEKKPEFAVLVDRHVQELRGSGIMEQLRRVGDEAPRFVRPNPRCESIALEQLFERGPVAISVYRGKW